MPESGDTTEIRQALAQLRKNLLDLTAHNPLVSFKHSSRGRLIRLIDELPDNIAEQLSDGKTLTFDPVQEPDEEEIQYWEESGRDLVKGKPKVDEWADECGILNSYDLPVDAVDCEEQRYTDSKLQTLYYPDLLEAKVSNLYRMSRTMVEETGTNLLHLTFGFLEWQESGSSEKSHFAPLYTIPVALEKGTIDPRTNTYRYTLRMRDDEVQFNASIAARLEDDFDFVLPKLKPQDLPEEYLDKIEEAIEAKFPRWKVHRWGTLAMLNFSRLLMYRDLDPDNWPEGHALDGHPLVKAVIERTEEGGGDEQEGVNGFGDTEYDIDEIPNIYDDFPLVDVADSSQHSALIDALKGKNLVIQGPPGTGKSQTITNLIAAAIYKGQTVLFVSEKLAALDVVKRRMDKLGLGEFCLELHSHNTKKLGIVGSLKRRLETRFRSSISFEDSAKRHGQLGRELNAHGERVNQLWKKTGKTILEILLSSVRHVNELEGCWEGLRIKDLTGESWTPGRHAETLDRFSAFTEQIVRISSALPEGVELKQHPWRGITGKNLDSGSIPRIVELLTDWKASLVSLDEAAKSCPRKSALLKEPLSLAKLKDLCEAIAIMPPEDATVHWSYLGVIRKSGLAEVDAICASTLQLEKRVGRLGNKSLREIENTENLSEIKKSLEGLLAAGMHSEAKLECLSEVRVSVTEILKLVARWADYFKEYQNYTTNTLPSILDHRRISLDGLERLAMVVEGSSRLQPGDFKFRSEKLFPHALGDYADTLRSWIKNLRKRKADLEKTFDIAAAKKVSNLSTITIDFNEPSAFRRFLGRDCREARRVVKGIMSDPGRKWDRNHLVTRLEKLESYFNDEETFRSEQFWISVLGEAFEGIDTDLERFERLVSWHSRIAESFGVRESKLFDEMKLNDTGKWLLEADEQWMDGLQRFAKVGLASDLKSLKSHFSKLIDAQFLVELPQDAELSDPENELRKNLDYFEENFPKVSSQLEFFEESLPDTLGEARESLIIYLKIQREWAAVVTRLKQVNEINFGGSLQNSPLPVDQLQESVAGARQWHTWLDNTKVSLTLAKEISEQDSPELSVKLRGWRQLAVARLESEQDARDAFSSFVSLDHSEWGYHSTLDDLQERIIEALDREDFLVDYLTFLRLRHSLVDDGFGNVCSVLESQGMEKDESKTLFEFLVSATLAGEIFAENEELRRFDGTLHSRKLKAFQECDRNLMDSTKVRTASVVSKRDVPRGYKGARVSEHTDLALIQHEVEKKKRHIPLRQMLLRAGKAVQALKPCFMMGPRSVANYLQPGGIEFDLLVIDEASQMRPADALGAVARCKQLVVVGDSKQLAPTSFFDRMVSQDEDDEEQFEASVSESILDAVAPVFSRRQLRWHYRSRHPSLIAFSNREFYDDRLMLFPSPQFDGEAQGIQFYYIENGVFEGGVNTEEAQVVVSRVVELLTKDHTLSIGVATMNAKQRDLIERLLEDRAKSNGIFAEAWALNRQEDEKLFIKNLENVQGDEREVIIISCTYGKNEEGGKVLQRFGPINSADGGRRLNVLFTRSRTRMEIFSSMQPSDIVVSDTSSEGVRAFRGMLRYADSGVMEGSVVSGREPDSDFEIAVARMLEAHGYEVECQIGVAGFFIDLAVKHPQKAGEYVLGVECDGAAYHSSKSARDRDRIRQDVLESMGWTIERIWSTDWFNAPEKALQPILDFLAPHQKADTA